MAIRNLTTTTSAADRVAILDVNGAQVFEGARPLKAVVSPEIQYMTHPREDGGNITDHRVILPIVVTLSVILRSETYRDTIQGIQQAANDSTEFMVQTKSGTYTNMRITSYPTEETPQYFSTIKAEIIFREIQDESARTQVLSQDQVRNPADSSTINRGQQSAPDAQANDMTIAQRIFS